MIINVCARFAHVSVGEGDNRHLILERCPETSMYVKTLETLTSYLLLKKISFITDFFLFYANYGMLEIYYGAFCFIHTKLEVVIMKAICIFTSYLSYR